MTSPTRTLGDYLKLAGVHVAEPAKTAAPVTQPRTVAPAAPAKKAETTSSQPTTEATDGHKPRVNVNEAEVEDTGGTKGAEAPVMYDPAIIKTAEQKALLDMGILIPDPRLAAQIYQSKVAEYQAQKTAEQRKLASQMENLGKMQLHGMWKEGCAMLLADDEATIQDAMKIAALTGSNVQEILDRAGELKKIAEQLAAAIPQSMFFKDQLGSAARTSSSYVMQGAEVNNNTTEFSPEALAGTRGPTQGIDEKMIRMTDTVTLPGNPGLNHGQRVDQGQGL